jgi:polyribonucleotide nucleotidyltransferase
MRMIDRPIRPLFPDGFIDEIQIQCWVMSHDGENDTDVLAGTAASAALAITDAPFEGPTATVRVGRIHTDDGPQLRLNPTVSAARVQRSRPGAVRPRRRHEHDRVGAAEVPEKDMLEAIRSATSRASSRSSSSSTSCAKKAAAGEAMGELACPRRDHRAREGKLAEKEMTAARRSRARPTAAMRSTPSQEDARRALPHSRGAHLHRLDEARSRSAAAMAKEAFRTLEKKITRKLIVEKGIRADGRKPDEIRPLDHGVGVFARARTARRSSSAARRSRWSPARSAPARTSRSSTACCPSTPRSSTCTTTSRPSAPARPSASWAPAGARSATARSPSARSWASCPRPRSSPTPSASSATSPSPTARRRWPRSAAGAWR